MDTQSVQKLRISKKEGTAASFLKKRAITQQVTPIAFLEPFRNPTKKSLGGGVKGRWRSVLQLWRQGHSEHK